MLRASYTFGISIHVLLKMTRDSNSAKYLSHKSLRNIQQLEADDLFSANSKWKAKYTLFYFTLTLHAQKSFLMFVTGIVRHVYFT